MNSIDNNTDISLSNIEAGQKELVKLNEDLRNNRGLIIKIFLNITIFNLIFKNCS